MKYKFKKEPLSEVIFVTVRLKSMDELKMILDTGASHTTIDFTALCMAGYVFDQAIKTTQIETANGVIDAKIFEIESLRSLGYTVQQIPVQVYDFLAHGILSDYDGMLRLDFFEGTVLTIDMENCTIEINPVVPSNQNEELLNQNTALLNQNAALSNENTELRRLLQQSGIDIPLSLN
jgi:hypothetical protein